MSVATECGEAGEQPECGGQLPEPEPPQSGHQDTQHEDLHLDTFHQLTQEQLQDTEAQLQDIEKETGSLLEDMLRLKLSETGGGVEQRHTPMLPPKQRIKLYQPRSKLEQFEDILLESQLLADSLPSLPSPDGVSGPLDYEQLEALSQGLVTDFEASDRIFREAEDRLGEPELGPQGDSASQSDSCSCDSCVERHVLVQEMAEETKKLQACWLELKEDFKAVYRLVLEGAWHDSNRPKPSLSLMAESVHKLVWRDPHQLYQRLEAQLREFVLELKANLVTLLQKQAKNPHLAQEFIQGLLGGHEKLCEACKLLSPVLSDLEVNHLRRFSLTWELLSKHLYQLIVYTDPLIQNNLPIFISQLRALYPAKEAEDKYTELVRGYLDFDVEMENVGVFWSGTEALLHEYTLEQKKLREKQQMLKNDWERFKMQRKQIETSLLDKPPATGGGEALSELGESLQALLSGLEECGVEALPSHLEDEMRRALSLSPGPQPPPPELLSPAEEGLVTHFIQQMMATQGQTDNSNTSWSTILEMEKLGSGVVSSSRSSESPASEVSLSSESSGSLSTSGTREASCQLTQPDPQPCECHVCTGEAGVGEGGAPVSLPIFPPAPIPLGSTAPPPPSSLYPHLYNLPASTTNVSSLASAFSSVSLGTAPIVTAVSSSTSPTLVPTPSPAVSAPPPPAPEPTKPAVSKGSSSAASGLQRSSSGCSHKHNNANAKELKKLMGHDCGKSKGKKCKGGEEAAEGEAGELSGSDSSPEPESCESSQSGEKHCACCYCEVFGHGGGGGAPVSRNYPEMRERLRLLLSKKKRGNRQQQQQHQHHQQHQHQQQAPQQQQPPQQKPPSQPTAVPRQQIPQQQHQLPVKKVGVPSPGPASATPSPQPVRHQQQDQELQQQQQQVQAQQRQQQQQQPGNAQDILAKKDVDEIIEYIEGNKTFSTNDKKRLKKERQKQQRLEELRVKQEEERRRKEAEEAARKAREEEERMRRDLEEKAAKKSRKKAAQKAKKLAAQQAATSSSADANSSGTPQPETPEDSEGLLDLENLRLKHIREQKELLEKQKQQLIEQQRKLDQQLTLKIQEKNAANAAVSAAEAAKSSISKKAAKRAAKAASKTTTVSSGNPSSNIAPQPQPPPPAPRVYPAPYAPPYQAQPHLGGAAYPSQPYYGSPAYPQHQPMPGYTPYGSPGMGVGAPPQASNTGFSPYSNPYMPPQPKPAPPAQPQPKSDQPMVTIKRVMRPDTNEPTVTISVKKDENDAKKSQQTAEDKEKVLFTLVNGQVMKTADAPDNLIPSAKPLPKDLAKRLLPESEPEGDAKLSKKQKKKLKAKMEEQQQSSAVSSVASSSSESSKPSSSVDLNKLRLPDGVSISKINGPVPERKYFPCKNGPEAPGTPSSWGQVPQQSPHPGQGFGAAQPYVAPPLGAAMPVDTNSMDPGAEKTSKKKKKKNKNGGNATETPQPQQTVAPGIWGQNGIGRPPMGGLGGPGYPSPMMGMQQQAPQNSYMPPAQPQAPPSKPKEWTPAQYGGYVPPADGKGGGQVLIKSVNGKVVITPVPGTGATVATTTITPATNSKKVTTAAGSTQGSVSSSSSQSGARPSSGMGGLSSKKPLAPSVTKPNSGLPSKSPAPLTNGVVDHSNINGNKMSNTGPNNNNIENQAPNEDVGVNGTTDEEGRKNKKNKKKRNPDEKLEEINSIFDPRGVDSVDMDAADREIEQFKQFCRDSVPAQNRAKVNFDVRNIAFKKK